MFVDGNGDIGIGTQAPAAKLQVRGDILLGSSAVRFALAGEENLRIISGNVSATGAIIAGTGFTCQRIDIGDYVLEFTTPFAFVPTMTITTRIDTTVSPSTWAHVRSVDSAGARVWIKDDSFNGYSSSDFAFCVIGPR